MAWNEQLPEWNETGAEPPQSKKDEGWEPEEKPPAGWFNWLFNRVYMVLQELQNKAENIDNKAEPDGYASLDGEGNVPEDQLGNVDGMEEHGNEYHNPDFATTGGTYDNLRAKSTTKDDVGLGNVTDDEQATKEEFDNHRGAKGTNEHSTATTSESGFLSSGDKLKLDEIEKEANNYTHPEEVQCNIIEESGSTGDGYYVRFVDGTQICYGDKIIYVNTSDRQEVIYPIEFKDYPAISFSVEKTDVSFNNAKVIFSALLILLVSLSIRGIWHYCVNNLASSNNCSMIV